ncbi:MAG: HAMP domain-containing histidine kinase [Ardenticatenaceae bacterium]|nr:HAMP domain-containing histidine kinase [Ardenticatenaceae bacterium]HBY95427.1 two-component sensor histidine kinase [Chloroflexota bacterium]
MRSLAGKLTLAFLFVGITGALLVALLVRWQTERQFDRFLQDLYGDEIARLTTQLAAYYQRTGSWDGINVVAIRDASMPHTDRMRPWQPVTLVDADGTVVSAGPHRTAGERLDRNDLRGGIPVQVEGRTAGWLLFDPLEGRAKGRPGSPEDNFLTNVWSAAVWSALGAAGLALILGALLAYTIARPVRDLTAATQAVARGELGRQVRVRARDEISELGNSFNRMSADLARAAELRRQMTADIAHDLRTPLSALLGYTEALSESKILGSPEVYGIMHQEAQHLQRLIDDLRTLSLADAGELRLHCELVPPLALLERVALAHGALAGEQDITVEVRATEELPALQVDPERMAQVLGNLVSNALRHTPAGGRITLTAEPRGENVLLRVRDSGRGIPEEDLPHIWERFYRGDKARSQEGSSGLGLAIARSLVEAHKGTISVESHPGQGATFTIALPVGSSGLAST